jgi:hypothetical protein
MALSDLAVFSEYVYSAQTEVLRQKIDLFNSATNGGIVLQSAAHVGDFSDLAMWAKISGLVRRRNAYGSGTVTAKDLAMLVDTMVKVAAGTPPVNMPPSMFTWIQKNPEEGGAVVGQQLAVETLADMLNTGILAGVAALSGVSAVVKDGTAGTAKASSFNDAQALFGDAYQQIVCWVMHSKPLFDIFGAALTNAEHLFTFGTVNVKTDPFGRTFVISDSPALFNATPNPDQYNTLGLTPGAIRVHQNGDFTDNLDTLNGDENIKRTYQAEWTYELGVKGFAWDKTNGGKSPNDAALGTSTNWDKFVTSNKDLAGILLKTQ